jgi:hypothetical protein
MLSTVPPPGGVLGEVPLRSTTSRASNNDFAGCCHPGQTRLPWGPQGAFKPVAGAVKATTGARSLKTFPVEVRDGAIWLVV